MVVPEPARAHDRASPRPFVVVAAQLTEHLRRLCVMEEDLQGDSRLWHRVPGYSNSESGCSDSDDSDEEELVAEAEQRLGDVVWALGDSWLDIPFMEFAPPPAQKTCMGTKRSSTSAGTGSSSSLRPPGVVAPSRWGLDGVPPSFRIARICAPLVQDTFIANGLRPTKGKDWHIQWSGPSMVEDAYRHLEEYQRVNHFPGSWELTRKDRLWLHFQDMARKFGGAFDFVPQSYVLPEQADEFMQRYENTNHIWIVKPNASSQGKGIFLLRDLGQLPMSDMSVVSRYVDNPLLIQGYKFDLRIYVLVTSFEPLRAYIYREGLTRFASSEYSVEEEHLQDKYRHLTNYSINKKADAFVENRRLKADNVGHKWSLSALNKHLKCIGINSDLMWNRIMDLIVKTLLSVQPTIASKTRERAPYSSNCFELYGFDVLVDEDLKPWLLEVNLSPSMMADSPLDHHIKSSLLSDSFNLVGVYGPSKAALATMRMRSQVHRLRQKMQNSGAPRAHAASASAMAMAAAAANASGGSPNQVAGKLQALVLSMLSEGQLKMLAQSLQETKRCHNFIRLYPTRSAIQRYAPIIEARTSPLLDAGLSPCRLLASLLFGPVPIRSPPAGFLPSISLARGLPVKSEEDAPVCSQARHQASDCLKEPPSPKDEPTPVAPLVDSDARAAISKQRLQQAEWWHPSTASDLDLGRVGTVGKGMFTKLGAQAVSRLAFMEYLVRVSNVCSAFGASDIKALSRISCAIGRLKIFRKQLSVFLRTTAKSHPVAVLVGSDAANTMHSYSFLNELGKTCRECLACLARGARGARVSNTASPTLPAETDGGLALVQYLPPAFLQSANGEWVTGELSSLSVSDLESILYDPQCTLDVRSFLETSAGIEDDELSEGRLSSSYLRQCMQDCCGVPCGPLTELLKAFAPRPPARLAPPVPPPQFGRKATERSATDLARSSSAWLLRTALRPEHAAMVDQRSHSKSTATLPEINHTPSCLGQLSHARSSMALPNLSPTGFEGGAWSQLPRPEALSFAGLKSKPQFQPPVPLSAYLHEIEF